MIVATDTCPEYPDEIAARLCNFAIRLSSSMMIV